MDSINGSIKDEMCKTITKDGVILHVITTKNRAGEWQLAILNEKGISSNWLEYFSTAQLAIDAGIDAIEKEGVEEFLDSEDFDY